MAEGSGDLKEKFSVFAKFGIKESPGKTMTSKNFDKWMKESKVQGKEIKSQDTDIAFNKVLGKKPKGTKTIEFSDLDVVITEIASHLAKDKAKKAGKDEQEVLDEEKEKIEEKLKACNPPGLHGTTTAVKSGAVDRLTDTSKYTGSHKERFDATGKGKGKAGREEVDGKAGYVQGYKNKGAFDKK